MSNSDNESDGTSEEDDHDNYASRLQDDLETYEKSLYSACRDIEELSRDLCDKNKISENDYIHISNKTKDVYTSYNSVVDTMCVMNQHVSLVYDSMASNIKTLEEENNRLKDVCKNNEH